MASPEATLKMLASGEARPPEAKAVLRELAEGAPTLMWQKAYLALRSWTWKALDGRRRDAELREWFDLLHTLEAVAARKESILASRFAVLHELVAESIAASRKQTVEHAFERRHVARILALMGSRRDAWLDRSAVGEALGLEQANLTRVLNLMVGAGLLERGVTGRNALFRPTRLGIEARRDRLPEDEKAATAAERSTSGPRAGVGAPGTERGEDPSLRPTASPGAMLDPDKLRPLVTESWLPRIGHEGRSELRSRTGTVPAEQPSSAAPRAPLQVLADRRKGAFTLHVRSKAPPRPERMVAAR